MGWYVHLNVCFACDENTRVADLARKCLDGFGGCDEAGWFLTDMASRSGGNKGPKGGLSTWGMVGNYTNGEEFVTDLMPFWDGLIGKTEGGPLEHEHVLVFVEQEQREKATAYEIFRHESGEDEYGAVTFRVHECPFAWMQY